jgi:ribonuclease R
MMVHRLLAHYLDGGAPKNEDELERLCKHSTDMEIKATDAERASIKYKQVEFMSDKIGQHFSGVISGVTSFGLFVELIDSKCEGLVAIRDLDDDYYEFDEDSYCLVGRQTEKKYQLGDELTVEVWRTNLSKKQLDFKLINQDEPNLNKAPRTKSNYRKPKRR